MEGSPARVKVAYFVPPSRHFAGVERVVHQIATGLAQAHGDLLDVHVLFATRYDEPLLADPAYTVHHLDVDRLRHLVGSLRTTVAAEGFDVLVVPQIEPAVIAWLATRGLSLPAFVTHLHGNPRVEEQGGSRRTKAAFTVFRRLVVRRTTAVLAVSPSLGRYAEATIARGVPVHYVPNPVREFPDEAGTLRRADDSDATFRFVNVARLAHQKGQDLLLRALALARPRLGEFHLTLVGSGPQEAELRRLCTTLGLDDVVTFAGYATDPASHLRRADCFVLCSRWEGFGVALVEALHFGLPVLSADCDFGPADVITGPDIGELVAPESVEALAEGLVRAVARGPDPFEAAARRAAAMSYSARQVTAKHLDVVRRIVASVPAKALA